ncbi:MAG: DUF3568 family protein [Phycisphaerales bacterium]
MTRFRRAWARGMVAVGVGAVLPGLSGCASRSSPRIDIGSYAFVSGEFVGELDRAMADAREDARDAMGASGLLEIAERRTRDGWVLAGNDERGRRVLVRVVRGVAAERTRVAISIGTIGDEEASAELFRRIREMRAPAEAGDAPAP